MQLVGQLKRLEYLSLRGEKRTFKSSWTPSNEIEIYMKKLLVFCLRVQQNLEAV